LAMAAGIAALKKLKRENVHSLLAERGAYLDKVLAPVLEKYKGKVLAKRIESIFTIYFTAQDDVLSLDNVKDCDMKLFAAYHGEMLNRGIYLSPSGYEVAFLSYAHSMEDIDATAKALEESLKALLG